MKLLSTLRIQLRSSLLPIGLIFAISAVPLSIVLFFRFGMGIEFSQLTRDPSTIGKLPGYIGFLSQIGVMFWSASVAICVLTFCICCIYSISLNIKKFIFFSAMLTLLLCLDDVFLLHEEFFPYIGISENFVYGSYVGLLLFYLIRFYRNILKTDYILLLMALSFFGMSIIVDLDFVSYFGINLSLLEDGFKLIGIVSWMFYFFRVGILVITQHNSVVGKKEVIDLLHK